MGPATVQAMAQAMAQAPVTARPVHTIGANVSNEDTTGPAGSGAGMDASRAGPCRMVSANPIGATSAFAREPAHSRRLAVVLRLVDAAQMRWNTSVPRTQRPPKKAFPVATTVVGPTKRPDQLVVTLQSDVQFLEV